MLPLLLPWIITSLVIVAIILSFWKKWRFSALLIVVAVIVNWWSECIPFRLWSISEKSGPRNIRVLTLNFSGTKKKTGEEIEKLVNIVGETLPDVIYISEFCEPNKSLIDKYFIKEYPYTHYELFHGYYSKYPLIERKMPRIDITPKGDVITCQTVIGKYTLAFWGCHLPSNNYTIDSKYITPDSIKNHSTLIQYVSDINLAYSKRINEVEDIAHDICQQDMPAIVLGDMNDVGGSETINLFESKGLKDAWWEGGFGYGATIHKPLPYRIDHILYSKQLKLNRVKVISSEGLSDHDAIFAEFSY